MAKGNYIALQALKPTELKVADYYKSFADDLIKRGDSDRAARAKMLEDKRKEVGAIFTDMKVDPFATISQASDLSTQSFIDTAQYVGQQRMLAEQDPANAYKYIQNAKRAHDDYRVLATTFGNKDFIDKANTKAQALASNDTFGTTDNNARLALLNQQMPIMKRNLQTGKMEFYLPKNESANPDEPLVGYSIGEIGSLFTSPDEINLLRSNKSNGNNGFMDKQIYDVAKLMSDEYSRNFDGNRTNAKTWFSAERGNQWFDTNFGVYNPNKVNPIVSQYARETLGRDISSEEDFNIAKQGIIGNIASLVGTETKVDTKQTATQQALDAARLQNLKASTAAANRSNRGGGGSQPSSISAVPSTVKSEMSTIKVQIPSTDGSVRGVQTWAANTMPLPKQKGFPESKNTFGLAWFKNAKGQDVKTLVMGSQTSNGKIVYAKINPSEFNSYVSRAGYDTYSVLNRLDENSSKLPYNRYSAAVDSSNKVYNNAKVGYESKDLPNEEKSEGVNGI